MSLEIKEVNARKGFKDFINLQFSLYKGQEFWVPPIKKDELKSLEKDSNPAYAFCDAKHWMVYDGSRAVGRISAIVNHKYNEKTGVKYGRFSRIEFEDREDVFDLLIDTALAWFKEKGLEKVHGPLGFSNLDTQGLLIEGFDVLPSIASVYHLPYYQNHFDRRGFQKENDWIEFRLRLSEQAVNKAARGAALVQKRGGFDIVEAKNKDELKKYAPRIFEILNDAFNDLPYVIELNKEMIELYTKKYFDILDPRFITLVKKEDELVGFFIGLPNLSEAMQKARGKLFPFGFTHVLKALKKPKVIDMLLTGVLHEYHSAGVAVILIGELQRRMLEMGITEMETTGIFEDNHNVISNWKNYDNDQNKRRRCYVKDL